MKYIIEDTTLTDIGDAIRGKKGTSALIPVPDLASEISSIPQGITPSGTKSITDNGTYDVTNYASATVNVPQGITPSGTVNITSNGNVDVTQYANANVNVPQGITPSGQISITENGTFDVTSFASALVNVSGGGDLPDWIEVGEFTPQQNLATYTISHNKGKEPQCAVYVADELHSITPYLAKIGFGFRYGDGGLGSGCAYNNNTGSMSSFSTTYPGIESMDTEKVVIKSRNATYQFKIGYTYKYIIIFKEEE